MLPGKIVIYYKSHTADWIVLRLLTFVATIASADWTTPLSLAGVEIPAWVNELRRLSGAWDVFAGSPSQPGQFGLPTVQALADRIPRFISPDYAFPVLSTAIDEGGLIIAATGDAVTQQIPYDARLMTWTFRGFQIFGESMGLSGRVSLVCTAYLYYRRAALAPEMYPLIDIAGYFQGHGMTMDKVWYAPTSQTRERTGEPSMWARTHVTYYGGNYGVDNFWMIHTPHDDTAPAWHFLAGQCPDMLPFLAPSFGGVLMPGLKSDYKGDGQLDTVPGGCNPDYPTEETLQAHDLVYYDSPVGSLKEIQAGDSWPLKYPHYSETTGGETDTGTGGVVETETEPPVGGLVAPISILGVVGLSSTVRGKLKRNQEADRTFFVGGDSLYIGGFRFGL